MLAKRLVLANAVDAVRALGLELSEQELLRKLSRDVMSDVIQSRSTVPFAQKNCNLVDIKNQYPLLNTDDNPKEMAASFLSEGDDVIAKTISTINAGFLIAAKEMVALDSVRAATWMQLSDQECELIEGLSVEEIINPRSPFQRRLLVKRGPNLTNVLSADTEYHRFISIGSALSMHAGIGEFEDVFQ